MKPFRLRRAWLPAVPLTALAAYGAAAGAAPTTNPPVRSLKTTPSLFPAFRPDVRDYVVRCGKSGLHLKATAAKGGFLTLDGLPAGPSIDTVLARRSGDPTTVRGELGSRTVTYHVRCLPADFPKWRFASPGRPQAQWYLMTPEDIYAAPSYVAVFDNHGVPVWWQHSPAQAIDATLLSHNRIAWAIRAEELLSSASRPFHIHRLDGSVDGTIKTPDVISDWHELRPLPNGNFLILGDKPRNHVDLRAYKGPRDATVLDGVAEEVTPTGKRVWKWNSHGHIPLSASKPWFFHILAHAVTLRNGRKAYDLVHLNAVEPYGSDVVISSRHTNAIWGVSRASGKVLWKVGGTQTPQSLVVPGADEALIGGQHDVRALPDGTLTVHDNRALYFTAPRILRLKLMPAQKRAQILESISGAGLRSFYFGSARKLPGGDWVVSWGGTQRVAELKPSGQTVVRFDFARPYQTYRAEPILPGQLASSALRHGMDAMAHVNAP